MKRTIKITFKQEIESDSEESIEKYCNSLESILDVSLQGGLIVSGCKTYRAIFDSAFIDDSESSIKHFELNHDNIAIRG